jgi:hypothetical protein
MYSYIIIRSVTHFQMAPELGPGMDEFDKLLTPTFVTNFGEFCLTCQFITRRSLWYEKEPSVCGGHVCPFILSLSSPKLSRIFVKFRM